jgi:tetratricopeptide (TPR) repeat protein
MFDSTDSDQPHQTRNDSNLHHLAAPAPTMAPVTLTQPQDDANAFEGTLPFPSKAALATTPLVQDRLGRYEIHGEIGHGGMGTVLRGHDPILGRHLAIKVLLASRLNDGAARRRFYEEAQISGQLQHPGLVPVYELGTGEDNRPFFAMKLVDGRTLAALLKERQASGIDLPRLLTIFEQVCQAVSYAHARGVIHRDLKPANVMVGAFGEVQVMDWGLAKVLGAKPDSVNGNTVSTADTATLRTSRTESGGSESRVGTTLGTPGYLPPEQARGEVDRLDRRSDVFGLGAILCQILTGQPPFADRSAAEKLQRAANGDLSDAFLRLDGCAADADLVTLAKDCLAPEADARPADAGVVAERVAAYRTGVQERLRKAELDRAAAEARASEAQARSRVERRARRLLLALAVSVLLGACAATAAAILAYRQAIAEKTARTVAEARLSMALASAQTEQQTSGKDDRKAAEIVETERRRAEQERQLRVMTEMRRAQAVTINGIFASIFHDLNVKTAEKEGKPLQVLLADRLDKASKALTEDLVGDPLVVAEFQQQLGECQLGLGYPDRAIQLFTRVQKTREALLGPDHPDTLNSMSNLASAYQAVGDLNQAIRLHELTLAKREARLGSDHPETLTSMNNLAVAYQNAGNLVLAIPLYEQELDKRRAMLGTDHPLTLVSMNNLAVAYQTAGKLDLAIQLFKQTLEKRVAILGPDHSTTLASMNNLAKAYQAAGKLDQAIPLFEQTLEKQKAALGPERPDKLLSMNNLAGAYEQAKQPAKAEPLRRDLVARQRKASGDESVETAGALASLGENLLQQGKWAQAEVVTRESLTIRDKTMPDDWRTFDTRSALGGILLSQGRYAEAAPLLLQGYEGMKQREGRISPADRIRLIEVLERLVKLYEATNQKDKADEWRNRLDEARKAAEKKPMP